MQKPLTPEQAFNLCKQLWPKTTHITDDNNQNSYAIRRWRGNKYQMLSDVVVEWPDGCDYYDANGLL